MLPALVAVAWACLLASPAVASAAEPTFTFTGRGWGHGIGMSQYGARGYAEHGWKYDAILKRYYQGTTLGTVGLKNVRVAIDKTGASRSSWTLRANTSSARVGNVNSGGTLALSVDTRYRFTATADGKVVVTNLENSQVVTTVAGSANFWEYGGGVVEVLDASGPLDWKSVCYWGTMRIVPAGSSKLWAVDHVDMEKYVRCVAPRETPASWHAEVLKAQSVAARSYAYVSLGRAAEYDVWCTTSSQVYNGWGTASGGTATRHAYDSLYDAPVAATANQVVKYGSTVVQTFFHSTSGGHTENIENVWSGATARPYYRGVSDAYESSAGSPYHVWPEKTKSYTATTLRATLGSKLTAAEMPAKIADVVITRRGPSGRVTEMVLEGVAGDDKTLPLSKISKVRSALGLRENWFYVTRFTWGADAAYVDVGQPTEVPFAVSPAVTGGIGGFVLRRGDGSTSVVSGSVTAGSGTVSFSDSRVGVRLDSSSLLPGTDLRGKQGYYYGPELPVTAFTETSRVAGADRYATSAESSKRSFPGTATTVVVASGVSWPDALAGSALAGAAPGGAPILLTRPDGLSSAVLAEIARLEPVRAYVLGGTAAVSDAVVIQLRGVPTIGPAGVQRLGGANRYDTARVVATEVARLRGASYGRRAFIVSGYRYPDAVAAAPIANRGGVPVLLVRASGVPSETAEALTALGVTDSLVVGGAAAVPDAALPLLPGATRVAAGADRYDTAARLADWAVASQGFTWSNVYVASGGSFADPLSAGPLAGRAGNPLLFVSKTAVPAPTLTRIEGNAATIAKGYVIGGSAAVSNACRAVLEDALR